MNLIETNSRISNQDLIFEAKIAGKIPELIGGILRRQTIQQEITAAGIYPTSAELQLAADRFRLINQLESAEATKQWLAVNLLSLDDFESIITHNLCADKLAHHLFDHQVEQFFYQNALDYSGAILYEAILEDQNLAMEIFYSIQEGDISFADVAHQYIADPELRRRGGYLGLIRRKQLRPEISAAVFAAAPPQLIKPIVTAVGVHLIQVEEIIHPQLDEQIHQQIITDLFERWLAEKIARIAPTIAL